MKKTKLFNIVMVIVISVSLLAGCSASVENQTISSNTVNKETVKTTAGLLQGTNNDGIYTYLGVPYAEATERFVPAGEVKPWDGVRKADAYGVMSPQGAIQECQ